MLLRFNEKLCQFLFKVFFHFSTYVSIQVAGKMDSRKRQNVSLAFKDIRLD